MKIETFSNLSCFLKIKNLILKWIYDKVSKIKKEKFNKTF